MQTCHLRVLLYISARFKKKTIYCTNPCKFPLKGEKGAIHSTRLEKKNPQECHLISWFRFYEVFTQYNSKVK